MSLSKTSYYDIYKVADYTERVDNIVSGLALARIDGAITQTKEKLDSQIKELKTKEMALLQSLGVDSLEELNKNIQIYNSENLKLSGPAMEKEFTAILDEKNGIENDAFQRAIDAAIRTEGLSNIPVDEFHPAIMNLLKDNLRTFNAEVGISKGTREVFGTKITKYQKKRWEELLLTKGRFKYKNGTIPKEIQRYIQIKEGFSDNTSGSITISWKTETKGMTPTEAKEFKAEHPDDFAEINQKMKKFIVKRAGGDSTILSQVIDYVLQEDPYAFFVGANVQGVTGILGEIQGLYYLCRLLGGTHVLNNRLKFLANSLNEKSKKSHRDILVDGFGIQVKNSAEEIKSKIDVSFVSQNLSTFLDQLNISPDSKEVLENYFGTKAFNIEYHVEQNGAIKEYKPGLQNKQGYIPKNGYIFQKDRERLLNMSNDVDLLLSVFAATLLYLDAFDASLGVDKNTLFLIGGASFQSAAAILTDIKEKIDNDAPGIHISSHQTTGKNIIDALNSGQSRNQNYSQEILKHINLTSSYKFTI